MQKSIARFNESLFRHQERQKEQDTQNITSEPDIAQQTRIHELNTSILDEMREADPYNDRSLTDTEMAERIDKLIEDLTQRTRRAIVDAALRAQLRCNSLPELPVTSANFPEDEILNEPPLNDTGQHSPEGEDTPHSNPAAEDADSESEDAQNNSTIAYPRYRACSLTPTMPQWSPRRSSTPKCRRKVRFKPLAAIIEQESDAEHTTSRKISSKEPTFTKPVSVDTRDTGQERAPITPLPLPQNGDKKVIYPIPPFPPLNDSIHITTTESDSSSEPQPIKSIVKNNVMSTHRCLTYNKDNIVHFISADCEVESPVIRLLEDLDAINMRNLKSKKPTVGEILYTPFKRFMVYSVVLRKRHYDSIDISTLRNSLRNLKSLLMTQKLRHSYPFST